MQNQYLQIYNKHFIWNHYHLFLRTNPPNHWSLPFLWTQPECDGPCQALFGRMQQISPGPCWLQSDFYFPWYGWWLKSGDHPFTGIHTSRVGAGFQPTVSPEKWWDTIPLLLGMASWGGHKKIIPWIFFPKLSRSKNFKKNWRMTLVLPRLLCFPSTTTTTGFKGVTVSFGSRIFLFVWKISTTKSWKSRWIRYIKYTSLGMCTKCWDPDHTDYCRMLHW